MILTAPSVVCYDEFTAPVKPHDQTLVVGNAPAHSDLTVLLNRAASGDASARDRVIEALYPHLRRLIEQRQRSETPSAGSTATDLFHEAFHKLIDQFSGRHWESGSHVLALTSRIMRHILIDRARRTTAEMPGEVSGIDEFFPVTQQRAEEILALEEALSQLGHLDPRLAQLVEMKVFGGCSALQIAEVLHISKTTVEEEWTFARAWLIRQLRGGTEQ